MADLIGRAVYTLNMVKQVLGLSEAQIREKVEAGELPKPLKNNRWDAKAIDKIYWADWERRKVFQPRTEE